MPDIEMDRVPENGLDCKSEDSKDETAANQLLFKKKRKRGIIYLSTIPPYMNVAKIREIFGQYGEINRVYLQPSGSEYLDIYVISF